MSALSLFKEQDGGRAAALWQRLWASNRLLALSAVVYAAMFVAMLALNAVDSRQVVSAPVWYKPMKFVVSGFLYTTTLAWMLGFVTRGRRLAGIAGGVVAVALFVEIALIVMQAVRGVPSHFNNATAFDAAVFSMMGMLIMVVWLANLVIAGLLTVQRLKNKPLAWAIRLALLLTLVGMGLGMLMVQPTPQQEAALVAGQAPSLLGAHSVGVSDGGAGLPFTGWSTEGGDLRVAHFAGMHALQALPLAAILIGRFAPTLAERRRTWLVGLAAVAYGGMMLLLTWQALRGQSLVAPDALTLGALGGLLGGVGLAGALVVRGGLRIRAEHSRLSALQ